MPSNHSKAYKPRTGSIGPQHLKRSLLAASGGWQPPIYKQMVGVAYDELPNSQAVGWGADPGGTIAGNGSWVGAAAGTYLSKDTTSPHIGTTSLRITVDAARTAEIVLRSAKTLRNHLDLWVRVSDWAKLGVLKVRLFSTGEYASKYHYWYSVSSGNPDAAHRPQVRRVNDEWVRIYMPRHQWGAVSAPAAWNTTTDKNVYAIQIVAEPVSGQSCTVDIGGLYYEDGNKPAIIIQSDGPYTSWQTDLGAWLVANGLPAVMWPTASAIGSTTAGSETLTAAQLLALQDDYGWEVGGHNYGSTAFTTDTTEVQCEASLAWERAALKAIGLHVNGKIWLSNAGYGKDGSNNQIGADIAERWFLYCAGAGGRAANNYQRPDSSAYDWSGTATGLTGSAWRPNDWHNLPRIAMHTASKTDFTALGACLDAGVRDGAVMPVYTHRILATTGAGADISTGVSAAFKAWLLPKVRAGELEVITKFDWYSRIVGGYGSTRFDRWGRPVAVQGVTMRGI